MTTTLIGTPDPPDDPLTGMLNSTDWQEVVPDPPDDPYGRDQAWQAIHSERARRAAENVAAREAAMAANVDPDSVDAFATLVAHKLRTTPALGAFRDRKPVEGDHPLSPYLVDWAEFWAADHDETEWLLEPLFADGRAHALYAQAKTGKSYLVLAACAALATGQAFLNHPGGEPVHVLYVDYEMTPQDVRERLEEFGYGPSDDLSHLHYALLPSLPPLDTEEGGQALLEAAQAVEARFVIIDTTSRAISGEENDNDSMRAFYRCTGLLLKQQAIGWMRLDHAGKDASKGQRGASAKNDDVDIVVRLERVDGGQRIIATHRRMGWYPEHTDVAVVHGEDGVTRFTNPQAEMWPEGTTEVAALLDELDVPLAATKNWACAVLRDADQGRRAALVAKALRWRRREAARASQEVDEMVESDGHSQSFSAGTVREPPNGQVLGTVGEPSPKTAEYQGGTAVGTVGTEGLNEPGTARIPTKWDAAGPLAADSWDDDRDGEF